MLTMPTRNTHSTSSAYQARLKRMMKQVNHALYECTDAYEQALLMTSLGELQLKLGELIEARTSIMIAIEYFRHNFYRTELKKAESLLDALKAVQ